jgi:KipI family sensor histidine kinase inhibitor
MPTAQAHFLGDNAILIRFSEVFTDDANRAAIALAANLTNDPPSGAVEIVPNLVSVLVRFDGRADIAGLQGAIRLAVSALQETPEVRGETHEIDVRFGGEDGPDLADVARSLNLDEREFVAVHNAVPLRVLAIGFAPGFVYCGVHDDNLNVPRRTAIRPKVPAGTIVFAAGQTAITATPVPTGWNVIGRTEFRNFDPDADSPVRLKAGDLVRFVEIPQ